MAEEKALYEPGFSYRIHFGRMVKNELGGAVIYGEEHRLEVHSLEAAKKEFTGWLENHKEEIKKKIIQNPELMEIRYVRLKPD